MPAALTRKSLQGPNNDIDACRIMQQWIAAKRDPKGGHQFRCLYLADCLLQRPGNMMHMTAKECPLGRLCIEAISLRKEMLQRSGLRLEDLLGLRTILGSDRNIATLLSTRGKLDVAALTLMFHLSQIIR